MRVRLILPALTETRQSRPSARRERLWQSRAERAERVRSTSWYDLQRDVQLFTGTSVR